MSWVRSGRLAVGVAHASAAAVDLLIVDYRPAQAESGLEVIAQAGPCYRVVIDDEDGNGR